MATITFRYTNGSADVVVEAVPGKNLMEIAKGDPRIKLKCTCEGQLACASCHVIVDDEHFAATGAISPNEKTMLSFATGLAPTSRLGCQVRVDSGMEGMVLVVPKG
jgi:ferredoxin